ncbi:MAG: Wadjet anti-phage system protein JetA family protein [Bacillota bacterium]
MHFFEVFPHNFFTLFASPNREIYVEALLVLHRQYRQETRLKKQEMVSRLVANMENRMLELQYEADNPFDQGDEINLSGRAHYLLRRFQETGWLEPEPDIASFEECFVIPGYASKLLNLFYDLLHGKTVEYNGFVYSTFSSLKTADQDRDEYIYDALKHAHQATAQLWTSLRELLDNIRLYHQRLQKQVKIKTILAEHFDQFRLLISDKIYHPLKTFDSVPRFKQRIVGILRSWLRDPALLKEIAQIAVRRGEHPDPAEARPQVIAMIGEIMDIYDRLDGMLSQIDRKNAAYTRASVERMQYYLNTDRDIRGKLVEVLKALPGRGRDGLLSAGAAAEGLPLYTGGFVEEGSLYTEPQYKKEHQPSAAEQWPGATEAEIAAELVEFKKRLQQIYSHQKVIDYILALLKDKTSLTTAELELAGSEDFVKLLLAVVKKDEPHLPYRVAFKDGYLYVNGFRLPELIIAREARVAAHVGS